MLMVHRVQKLNLALVLDYCLHFVSITSLHACAQRMVFLSSYCMWRRHLLAVIAAFFCVAAAKEGILPIGVIIYELIPQIVPCLAAHAMFGQIGLRLKYNLL